MIKQPDKEELTRKISQVIVFSFIFLFCYICRLNLAIGIFLVCLYVYLKSRRLDIGGRYLLHLSLLFLCLFVPAYFVINYGAPLFYIPFTVVPMLAILLFNNLEIALLITLAQTVVIGSLTSNSTLIILLFFTSGILSAILVQGARRRNTIIRSGIITGGLQAVFLLLTLNFSMRSGINYIILIANGIASTVIVLGVLPIFEYLFSRVTNISLLELTDFNHPILQRMIMEAPGTYHHSLVVGNLAESASNAIGANPLLSRIGAYYHDIGKLQKPQYFSENQALAISRHKELAPNMSKLIIMNHVKEGCELAKKYKLNPRIIDFITQHHGNSLVYYFYMRALEGLEDDEEVKEEGFRYPGPRPKTKETAIVLLADSVEAATRALKEPTPKNIEDVVRKIINNKFIDGQLNDCDLTLRDMEKISEVFCHILSGIYHSRVSYPESGHNHK